jgi:bacteriocin biosynthesis cyclodehydratase domain-containing protein
VAGEDFRYTLTGPGLEQWLPAWLTELTGRQTLEEALTRLPESLRESARQLVDRLWSERVLIDGPVEAAHRPASWRLVPERSAAWMDGFAVVADPAAAELPVLCQDRLDYEEALQFNRRRLAGSRPWLWATTGPMGRGYVSPLFLPDVGPCLSCLLRHFRRLSPVPELYDALAEHARAGRPITAVPFPAAGAAIVRQLVAWKAALAAEPVPSPALYRLHVLEAASLEVTSHQVFIDPECPECGGRN